MRKISLLNSSLKPSCLAYGCWRIAGTWDPAEVTPDKEAAGRQALITAYEAGYTLFDQADIYCYGATERIMGKLLKEIPEMRDRILIATKAGIRKRGEPNPESPYRYDFSAEHLIGSCEQSLKRLGIETIDLFQLHRPDYLCDPAEVAEAFEKLHRSGKALEFGVSNFRPFQVAALQRACSLPIVVNQIEVSLLKLDALSDGTLDQCLMDRITPMAWSPLGGGRLGNGARNEEGSLGLLRLLDSLDSIAQSRGVCRTVVALAWLLKHPSRILPIVGTTNPKNIREALQAADLELTRDEWYRLFEAAYGQRLP